MTTTASIGTSEGSSRFENVLVTRTIRAVEDSGPLEDASELRDAARQRSTHEDRIVARARGLGRRIGLLADLQRMGALSKLLVPLTALVVVSLTWMLVASVLGEGRRINVVLAWLGVLGPGFIGLAVWVAAVLAPGSPVLATLARGLGGLALRFFSRPKWAGSHAPALSRTGIEMLEEARLLPWAFGVINHGIWALSYAGLIAVLYVMFALRAYELTWESTILSEASFVDFITTTGRLAEMLGLPRASVAGLQRGHAAGNPQLAFWLMYCVLLYGFVPRLLLGLWSWRKWVRAKDEVRLDLNDSYYRRLVQRFDELAAPAIVDAEQAVSDAADAPAPSRATPPAGPPVWIAFELPSDLAWGGAEGIAALEVAGDSEGRHRVVDRLVREPAARAVVVCNAASSPDRGTARFLRDVSSHVGAMALLLVGPGDPVPARAALWAAWLKDCGLDGTPVFDRARAAQDWQSSTGVTA